MKPLRNYKISLNITNIIINAIMLVISLITIYPFVYTFSISVSSIEAIYIGSVKFFPVGFNLNSYIMILKDSTIFQAYINTLIYTLVGMIFVLMICSLTAYPLTFDYSKKKIFTKLMIFTMYFNAGMIPAFLVVKNLGLLDSMWALVLPAAFNAWNVIIFRSFFSEIPIGLKESANIDGAGEFTVFFKIYVPLSKPVFAALGLFAAVGFWNNFFGPMLYIRTPSKQTLSLILRQLIVANEFNFNDPTFKGTALLSTEGMKAATIMVTIIPIILLYPFLQKYFVKGMMIGAIKG